MRLTRRDALLSSLGIAASASLSGIEAGRKPAQDASVPAAPQNQTSITGPPLSLNDYETIAKQKLSHVAWEYYASGSGDEHTVRCRNEVGGPRGSPVARRQARHRPRLACRRDHRRDARRRQNQTGQNCACRPLHRVPSLLLPAGRLQLYFVRQSLTFVSGWA